MLTDEIICQTMFDIVEAFIKKHKISCSEDIHQNDRVIEDAYELIDDLASAYGWYQHKEE